MRDVGYSRGRTWAKMFCVVEIKVGGCEECVVWVASLVGDHCSRRLVLWVAASVIRDSCRVWQVR